MLVDIFMQDEHRAREFAVDNWHAYSSREVSAPRTAQDSFCARNRSSSSVRCRESRRCSPDDAIREMHLSKCEHRGIASGAAVATCKTRDFRENVADFDAPDGSPSQKEKKIFCLTLNLSRLFRGTMFASAYCCADNLLPRDPAPVPKPRPGCLNRRLPTAVPTRSPAVLFSPLELGASHAFHYPAFYASRFLLLLSHPDSVRPRDLSLAWGKFAVYRFSRCSPLQFPLASADAGWRPLSWRQSRPTSPSKSAAMQSS